MVELAVASTADLVEAGFASALFAVMVIVLIATAIRWRAVWASRDSHSRAAAMRAALGEKGTRAVWIIGAILVIGMLATLPFVGR